jgi:hypothetical protein
MTGSTDLLFTLADVPLTTDNIMQYLLYILMCGETKTTVAFKVRSLLQMSMHFNKEVPALNSNATGCLECCITGCCCIPDYMTSMQSHKLRQWRNFLL